MSDRVRSWLPIGGIAVIALLAALAAGSGRDTGRDLDPASTGEAGTKALILLLREMGGEVTIGDESPDATDDVALLLADRLDKARTADLLAWVRAGGTLVVADPLSEFAPTLARERGGLFGNVDGADAGNRLSRRCALPAVRKVAEIEVPALLAFDVPEGHVGCFPTMGGSFLVASPEGRGTIAAMTSPVAWTNRNLDQADNAVLAVSLLAPSSGTRLRFLEPPGPGEGRRSLSDLIRPSVKSGLWELAVAFLIFALWRARRLGRPIAESQPVTVPGSELVVAVGHMLQQAKRRDQALAMLRHDLRRTLGQRLGLRGDTPREQLVGAVAAHTSFAPERVESVLFDRVPASDAALVEIAAAIDSIRTEVLHA